MKRRDWFVAAGAALGAAACAGRRDRRPSGGEAHPPFELDEISAATLGQKMAAGELTARSIAEAYLRRLDEIDRHGPALRAVIETNPAALEIAGQLDGERREGQLRGPLHGIPVLLKDNIDTGDRMLTTAGSLALEGAPAPADAAFVAALRRAGAVILGKTNLSEWANIRSSRSTSGWSARGGLTRNPYALDRNACGSSSGSAVAVSANLCPLAVGTETNGSVICPSSINGIVGIKPTVGLVSQDGIIPISHSQDTAGPMARSVADAALLLGAMTGAQNDSPDGRIFADYAKFAQPGGLQGARIGVARGYSGRREDVDRLMEEALGVLRSEGTETIDIAGTGVGGDLGGDQLDVLLYELKAGLNRYLARRGPDIAVRTLADVIEFNETHRGEELRYFGQDLLTRAEEKGPLTSPEYLRALEHIQSLTREQGIDAIVARHELDAIAAPSTGPAWITDLVNGDPRSGLSSAGPAAIAGYPSVTVPMGFVEGLPVGLSLFGKAYREPKLIELAYGFEQASRVRRPPSFAPTAA